MGVILAWRVLSGNALVRLTLARLRPAFFADILRVGGIGSLSALQTTHDRRDDHGSRRRGRRARRRSRATAPATRLEYLLIPLVFGLGAPMVAMVGTNVGAGQRERALRVAMIGGGASLSR